MNDLHGSTMPLGLLAGIEVDPVQAIVTPDMQHQVGLRRAAERHRSDSPL